MASAPGQTRVPEKETPCLVINHITLAGERAELFQWALAAADLPDDAARGRCLGASGVDIVAARVQRALVQRGWATTRVVATSQDLASGTLTLTVLPGHVRGIRWDGKSQARATLWNAVPIAAGDLLDVFAIEQGLANFKRLPTVEANIAIVSSDIPGALPGDSDLEIHWTQKRPLRFTVTADDAGNTPTGKLQGSVTLAIDHGLALNDMFYVSTAHSLGGNLDSHLHSPGRGRGRDRGTRATTLHYQLPFDYWLLGATASTNTFYQTVAGAVLPYVYSGTSSHGEVRLTRLLQRTLQGNTGAYLRGWQRSSNNFIDDTEVQVQRRRWAGWEIGVTHRENLGSNSVDASLAYRRGTGMGASLEAPEQAFGEGSTRPQLITADVQWMSPFTVAAQALRASITWRAQWNRTPLVPQDRFFIGSRATVRGFDGVTGLLADRGWLLRNELSWQLPEARYALYLGLDHGAVGGPSAQYLPGRRLTGAVLGARGGDAVLSWDLFAGGPLAMPEGFQTASVTAGFNLIWTF